MTDTVRHTTDRNGDLQVEIRSGEVLRGGAEGQRPQGVSVAAFDRDGRGLARREFALTRELSLNLSALLPALLERRLHDPAALAWTEGRPTKLARHLSWKPARRGECPPAAADGAWRTRRRKKPSGPGATAPDCAWGPLSTGMTNAVDQRAQRLGADLPPARLTIWSRTAIVRVASAAALAGPGGDIRGTLSALPGTGAVTHRTPRGVLSSAQSIVNWEAALRLRWFHGRVRRGPCISQVSTA
jgi:hypothetical protein